MNKISLESAKVSPKFESGELFSDEGVGVYMLCEISNKKWVAVREIISGGVGRTAGPENTFSCVNSCIDSGKPVGSYRTGIEQDRVIIGISADYIGRLLLRYRVDCVNNLRPAKALQSSAIMPGVDVGRGSV